MRRFLVPMAGFALVSGLGTFLIWGIVLTSPDTHAHLWDTLRPEYDRTAPITVGQEVVDVEMTLKRGRAEIDNPIALEPGQEIYLASGCATCHGVDARGGAVGPSLANPFPDFPGIVKHMVREGPGGMPTYSEAHVSDADLERMAAYLQTLAGPRPDSKEIVAIQNLRWDPSVPQASVLQGKAALRRSCGACHTQPTKEEILHAFTNDAQSAGLVAEMVRNTNLSIEDARAIAYYMGAILNGADPVEER